MALAPVKHLHYTTLESGRVSTGCLSRRNTRDAKQDEGAPAAPSVVSRGQSHLRHCSVFGRLSLSPCSRNERPPGGKPYLGPHLERGPLGRVTLPNNALVALSPHGAHENGKEGGGGAHRWEQVQNAEEVG